MRTRTFFFGALALWALAWVLPSYDPRLSDGKDMYGWHCYWTIMGLSPKLLSSGELWATAQGVSAWTNLLIPAAVLALHRRRSPRLLRALPVLFAVAWAVNLIWLGGDPPEAVLLIGYYLWLFGFLLLGGAILALVRNPDPAAGSLLVPDPDRPVAGGVLTALVVVGFLLLFVPLALGVAELLEKPTTG